jgi:hypothetical protein
VPLSLIPLSDLKPKSDSSVVIEGGKFEFHKEVLRWILSCCEAGKTVTFRWFDSPAFFDYGLLVLSCEKLQVNVLEAQVLARMQALVARQVHSIDVERVPTAFPGPHKSKDMVCQGIGGALWEGRLQAFGAYNRLFKMPEYREFKEGTDNVYLKLETRYFKTPEGKVARKEREEQVKNREGKREAAKFRHEQHFQRAVARHHKVGPSDVKPTGNGNYTLSTDGRRVRKGHGGRPGFVQVDLGSLGVTPSRFRASEFPTLPPKGNNKASTPDTKEKSSDTTGATPATTPANNAQTPADAKKSDSKGKGKAGSVAGLSNGVEGVDIGKE